MEKPVVVQYAACMAAPRFPKFESEWRLKMVRVLLVGHGNFGVEKVAVAAGVDPAFAGHSELHFQL